MQGFCYPQIVVQSSSWLLHICRPTPLAVPSVIFGQL
jgi:hypothetical protein